MTGVSARSCDRTCYWLLTLALEYYNSPTHISNYYAPNDNGHLRTSSGIWVMRYHWPLTRYVNCGLHMHRECRERFPHHRLQRKPLVSDPGMHHGSCVTHVQWCMPGSLTRGGGETFPAFPVHAQPAIYVSCKKPMVYHNPNAKLPKCPNAKCATRNFAYLARGPCNIGFREAVPDMILYFISRVPPNCFAECGMFDDFVDSSVDK